MNCDRPTTTRALSPTRAGLLFVVLFLLSGCGGEVEQTTSFGKSAAETLSALESDIRSLIPQDSTTSVAVSLLDPSTGIRLHVNGDRLFHAASTMKVPVMIEVFRRHARGELALDDEVELRNEFRSIVDGSTFSIEDDTDDAIYEHLGESMTIRELTESMITVSSNLATNLLIDILGADSVQATSRRLGTEEMVTLRGVEDIKAFERGLSNRASSSDLALLMEAIMTGHAVSAEASAAMMDILLEQQFGEMIPQGLPENARVAHKTGRITAINHDAAIIHPPESDPYVLVILTEGWEDAAESSRLAARITDVVHRSIRPDGEV